MQPFLGAHFAVMPMALAEQCIKAGISKKGCCSKCGKPWIRIVKNGDIICTGGKGQAHFERRLDDRKAKDADLKMVQREKITLGWKPDCSCDTKTMPCTILDPFNGAATTGVAALKYDANYIGIELNSEYIEMSRNRLMKIDPLCTEDKNEPDWLTEEK
jgi:uncharacterized Zn finger protein (UPF0148 family)